MRYRLMPAEKGSYPVAMAARMLEASRPGLYARLSRGAPDDPRAGPRESAKRVWEESGRRFGARLIKRFLPDELSDIGPYRVRKCMREPGIRGCAPYRPKRTTMPDENAKPRPDPMRRDSTSPVPAYKPVGDIACLRTGQDWLCLATVIDLSTRMVVGWSLSGRTTADIAAGALAGAKARGYAAENAIFRSDRGARYASRLLAAWARENDVRLSCSRTGNRRGNAAAEPFFATLKNEMHCREGFATRAEAKAAVIKFIEVYYNRRRPHSTIGCKIPAEVMGSFFERTKPEASEALLAA